MPHPLTRRLSAALVLLLLAASQIAAAADRIERKDGRVVEGRIVDESKDAVTIETRSGDLSVRQRIARSAIRHIDRESREGPGYCVIPIEGAIGVEVTADAFRRALHEAKQSGATVIVLSIDSPGGYLDTLEQMLTAIKEQKGVQFVAHVKRALSSAAVLALACPKIYVTDRATIGAAVAFKVLPDGSPGPVEAKFRSAIGALWRNAASVGGHSDLWIRGMSEPELELAMVTGADGKPRLVEAGTQWEGERLIKRRGQILTLTAAEAKEWGLCAGIAKDLDDVRKSLAIEKWHDAGDGPASIMLAKARSARAKIRDAQERRVELVRIDQQTAAAMNRLAAATKEVERVNAAFNRDATPILRAVQAQVSHAQAVGASAAEVAAIKADGSNKIDQLRAQYTPIMAAAMNAGNAAMKELADLKTRRAQVLASLQD